MTILCCQVGGFVEDFLGVFSGVSFSLDNHLGEGCRRMRLGVVLQMY